MKADFNKLSPATQKLLVNSFQKMSLKMNEQEVCSTLNGLAKMDCKWENMDVTLQNSVIACLTNLNEVGTLCLACSVFALGQFAAPWDELPDSLRQLLCESAEKVALRDQILSNVVHGLSCMKASWSKIGGKMRKVLVQSLASKNVFGVEISQHVANTIWGLGKMGASWQALPQQNLLTAYINCSEFCLEQENTNILYGLAVMGAIYKNLPTAVHVAISKAVARTSKYLTPQVILVILF